MGQSFLVAVGDVTVVLPREAVWDGLHQAWERGAIGEIDVGAALPAQALGRRPSTSSLDGGCMPGGQFPGGGRMRPMLRRGLRWFAAGAEKIRSSE